MGVEITIKYFSSPDQIGEDLSLKVHFLGDHGDAGALSPSWTYQLMQFMEDDSYISELKKRVLFYPAGPLLGL